MEFPAGKIADVARVTDESRPATFDIHHGLVQADGKEDGTVLFAFLL